MSETKYYSIHIRMSCPAPSMMMYQEDKGELYLTVHGRLGSLGKEVHLRSEELANSFMSAYLPRLINRYGEDVKAKVIVCSSVGGYSKGLLAKIEAESDLAVRRIETGILASNRRPD